MLSFLIGLVKGILSFLSALLPGSPLQGAIDTLSGAETGIGWLNFFVPVGGMLAIFSAWLAALVIWMLVTSALRESRKAIEQVI